MRNVVIAAGAGYLVPLLGEMVRMPGLGASPQALRMDLVDGKVVGLLGIDPPRFASTFASSLLHVASIASRGEGVNHPGVMSASPAELRLEITPRARFDVIDINQRILEQHGGVLGSFQKAVYFSYHTTAGYLEQALSARLNGGKEGGDALQPYIEVFQTLFPAGASYRHDQMELRDELSLEQKVDEPRNADSHLAYIGSGLRSCVTYKNRPGSPVYFIDLDGEYEGKHRRRLTSVVGYNADRRVATRTLEIPVSGHPIDSINLKDPKFGLYQSIQELVNEHGVARGGSTSPWGRTGVKPG